MPNNIYYSLFLKTIAILHFLYTSLCPYGGSSAPSTLWVMTIYLLSMNLKNVWSCYLCLACAISATDGNIASVWNSNCIIKWC